MDNNLKREIIIDNYENPFHKEVKDNDNFIKVNTHNESCIDNIDLYVKVDNGIIIDAYFSGEACAITTSATSIMLKKIIGLSISEARIIMKEYYNMINEEDYNKELLGELNAYYDIGKQASRIKCATLPFQNVVKETLSSFPWFDIQTQSEQTFENFLDLNNKNFFDFLDSGLKILKKYQADILIRLYQKGNTVRLNFQTPDMYLTDKPPFLSLLSGLYLPILYFRLPPLPVEISTLIAGTLLALNLKKDEQYKLFLQNLEIGRAHV